MHKDIIPLIKSKRQVSFGRFFTSPDMERLNFTKEQFLGKKSAGTCDFWTVYIYSNGQVRIREELARGAGRQTEYLYM